MSKCDGPGCKCWANGYVTGTRDAAQALAESGMFEQQDLAQKLIAEAHLVTHPVPETVPVKRFGDQA